MQILESKFKNKFTMNKLSIAILLAVAVCSTYGVSDRRSVRSAISEVVEVSSEASLVANAITEPKEHKDSVVAESVLTDLFTGNTQLVYKYNIYTVNVILNLLYRLTRNRYLYSNFLNISTENLSNMY